MSALRAGMLARGRAAPTRERRRARTVRWIAYATALLVVLALYLTDVIGGAGLPGDWVTSGFESATGKPVYRDCGVSIALPGAPRHALWFFCDTAFEVNTPQGARAVFLPGSTAVTGAFRPGEVPRDLRELPAPPAAPGSTPAGGQPQAFFSAPAGLSNSAGGACAAGREVYAASWLSGVMRLPTAPGRPAELLLTYIDNCVQAAHILTEGFGIAEYDPARNRLLQTSRVFRAAPGGPLAAVLQLGSPVLGRDGYVYLFAAHCNARHHSGGCLPGQQDPANPPSSVFLARVLPIALANPAAYQFYSPGGWVTDLALAGSVLPGATPNAISVGDYTALGKDYVMVVQTGVSGSYQLWRAPNPAGPWRPSGGGTVGCVPGKGALNLCRAINGHPELSTSAELMLSYYNPGDDHVHVIGVPW